VVPFGGSSPLSAQGYVDAAVELEAQLDGIDHVVVAVGSGGTMAGLVAHLGSGRVVGIDTGAVPDAAAAVGAILDGLPVSPDRLMGLEIHRDQVGAGYHELTSGAGQAMGLAARTEGLFIDPVYTARALAGLAELVRTGRIGRGRRTVFMVTGGLPGLFGHPQLADLLS
jgi:D-cysteine desulfhydrase